MPKIRITAITNGRPTINNDGRNFMNHFLWSSSIGSGWNIIKRVARHMTGMIEKAIMKDERIAGRSRSGTSSGNRRRRRLGERRRNWSRRRGRKEDTKQGKGAVSTRKRRRKHGKRRRIIKD
jgi:hypothetical protein